MARELSAEERRIVRRIQAILGVYQGLRYDMPITTAEVLLQVALDEGKTLSEYSRLTGVNMQTLNRQLLDLSDRDRFGNEGYRLIEQREVPEDRRAKRYFMTPKGWKIIDQLKSAATGT